MMAFLLVIRFPCHIRHGLMHRHLWKSLALDSAHDLAYLKDELLHVGELLTFRLMKMC